MKNTIIAAALALTATTTLAQDIRIATGCEGGGYEALGYKVAGSVKDQLSRKGLSANFNVMNTNGSLENLELYQDGDVEIAIVQADTLNVVPPSRRYKSKTAHTEVVYWFANKKNDYTSLEDIEGKTDVKMVIVEDSGADITMRNFVQEDKGYQKTYKNAIFVDDLYDAFDIVSEGNYEGSKVAGLLYVTRPGKFSSEYVTDFGDSVVIGELEDKDFNDAEDANHEKLYTNCEVDKRSRGGFQTATTFSPDTICMKAKVIYTQDFDSRDVSKAVKRGVVKAVR